MSDRKTPVQLGEILTIISRPEAVNPTQTYDILGARWYAKGLYIKEQKKGSQIQANTLFRVEKGDLVYNRLFAWKGSFALADEAAHGCYVSNEFPCFSVNSSTVLPKYLFYYFSQESWWNQALGLSTGGTPTSRNRLKEKNFLALEVPLPSLKEQGRLVEGIESLSGLVSEAQQLREESFREASELCRSIIRNDKDAQLVPMRDLVKLRSPDVDVEPEQTYQFAGVYCFGRGVFRGNAKSGNEFAYSKLTRIRSGDFVYPKLMAWEGALGVVPQTCDGCVVSTEFPVFEVIEEKVLPEVLDVHFRSPTVWPELSGSSTGTNVRRRRLNPTDFLAYRLPLPSRTVQYRLRAVMATLREAEKLQGEVLTEYKALMPSVLKNAFSMGLL
ncbi:restriction endonuclease subunit S [Tunturiibacter lichenicola]|uniref:restriction endonuclease subunit S n=1 Tax=Tunturiibacter lichenicola TaxID=2051959 RepID=UPI0021B1A204|nr:restriction endonuclease subunit S [Edaphobacter lichenicola]